MLFPLRPNQYGRNNYPGRLYSVPQRPYILFLRPVCLVCSSASQNSVIQQPNDSFYLRAKYVLLLRLLLRLRPSILFLRPIILYFRAKYSVLPRQIFCSSAPISLFFRAK